MLYISFTIYSYCTLNILPSTLYLSEFRGCHSRQVYNRLEAMKVAKVVPPSGKLPNIFSSCLNCCSLTTDEFNLPHFVGGVGNETRCTLYGDFEGFARQKCAWKFGLVSYDDFPFEFCFWIECLQWFGDNGGGWYHGGVLVLFCFLGRQEKGKGKKILMMLQVANQSTQNGWLPYVYFWYDEYPIIFEPRGSY